MNTLNFVSSLLFTNRTPLENLISFAYNAFTSGTPASDLLLTRTKTPVEILIGRNGNDTVIAYDPASNNDGVSIDIIAGEQQDEDFGGKPSKDRFVLGEWRLPYYLETGNSNQEQKFAWILDFQPDLDLIQLHGTAKDYRLETTSVGTNIYFKNADNSLDLVAIVANQTLSLGANYFLFDGYLPVIQPSQPLIEQLGTPGLDRGSAIHAESNGNVFVGGTSSGSLFGDNLGSYDAWIVKYDSTGNQIWAQQFGTEDMEYFFTALTTDDLGNLYATGTTKGDLGGENQGREDGWTAKFDPAGNLLWIQQYPATSELDLVFAVDVDSEGNVYVGGGYTPSLDIKNNDYKAKLRKPFSDDNDPDTLFNYNAWVAKYSSEGDLLWFQDIASSDQQIDETYGVFVGQDGNIYVTGLTWGNVGGENAGFYDVWAASYDSEGNQLWVTQTGSEGFEYPWAATIDPNREYFYQGGWTDGVFPGQEGQGDYDSWIIKYNLQGEIVWTKQFGTEGDDGLLGMATDSEGNIYATGYTNSSFSDFSNEGDYDAWVAKFDSEGNQLWVNQFGTNKYDLGEKVSVDDLGKVWVTGTTEGSLGGINEGSVDAWFASFDSDSGALI